MPHNLDSLRQFLKANAASYGAGDSRLWIAEADDSTSIPNAAVWSISGAIVLINNPISNRHTLCYTPL
jgi:hypothetical protein